jgi:hypothetical protein
VYANRIKNSYSGKNNSIAGGDSSISGAVDFMPEKITVLLEEIAEFLERWTLYRKKQYKNRFFQKKSGGRN